MCNNLLNMAHNVVKKCSKSPCTMLAKHAAVIFKGDTPLIIGENRLEARAMKHPSPICKCSKHAEIIALNKYNNSSQFKDNEKCNILIIQIGKENELKMSRPCFLCAHAIFKSRKKIKKVYYSTGDGNIICENIYSLLNFENIHVSIGFGIMNGTGYLESYIKKNFGKNLEIKMIDKKTYRLVQKN